MSAFELKQAAELASVDDWSSAWEDCKRLGLKWGGRGRGGRAAGRQTMQTHDIFVEGCTLAYLSHNLLDRTTLRLLHGRRYGLIGRNGIGKSTLLRRISTGTLPGFPQHIRVSQVYQDLPSVVDPTVNAVQYILANNPEKLEIEKQISDLENADCPEGEMENQANMLSSLYDMLEDEGTATTRAIKILKDLGFNESRRNTPVSTMSGGWLMRLSLALALFQEPGLLLLDEPTNHLDIEGVEWLKQYILGPAATAGLTILVTSHDRMFLDAICTDIIRFHKQHLEYYPGNYTDYENTKKDRELGAARTQDYIDKQRKHIEESIQKMQVVASKSESKTGMVASRKKKLTRLGAEKNIHGHRFRAQQDSYEGLSAVRSGAQTEIALGHKTGESRSLVDGPERETKMKLPSPPPLGAFGPLFSFRNVSLGYICAPLESVAATTEVSTVKSQSAKSNSKLLPPQPPNIKVVLKNISLDIDQNAKIAIIGKNGAGKSTLLQLLIDSSPGITTGLVNPAKGLYIESGELTRLSGFRIAYYQQNLQENLPFESSALQYLMDSCPEPMPEQIIRGHLGSFGLSGDLVLRQIGTLSGGQKSRIVLAQLTINRPNLLLLDEPTNNLDLDAIRALSDALKDYEGAFVLASHDISFVQETSDIVYHLFKGSLTRLEGGTTQYLQMVQASIARQKSSLT